MFSWIRSDASQAQRHATTGHTTTGSVETSSWKSHAVPRRQGDRGKGVPDAVPAGVWKARIGRETAGPFDIVVVGQAVVIVVQVVAIHHLVTIGVVARADIEPPRAVDGQPRQ